VGPQALERSFLIVHKTALFGNRRKKGDQFKFSEFPLLFVPL
jgi:hypothetical protein